jgi:hypothetical protein
MSTSTLIWITVVLWFAVGWYMNMQLAKVHAKIDRVFEALNGLREYLYEIDPQFDEERELLRGLFSDEPGTMFAGMNHLELTKRKEEEGYRTLNSTFFDGGFRAPNR